MLNYNEQADKLIVHFLEQTRRCRVVGRARTIGNRVRVKSSSRVRISPSPPRRRGLHIVRDDFFIKSHRSFIPSLLLSKSNPLRWASIWFMYSPESGSIYGVAMLHKKALARASAFFIYLLFNFNYLIHSVKLEADGKAIVRVNSDVLRAAHFQQAAVAFKLFAVILSHIVRTEKHPAKQAVDG